MKRCINLLATASLLAFVATVGIWIRSLWVGDELRGDHLNSHGMCVSEWSLVVERGSVDADYSRLDDPRYFRMATSFQHTSRAASYWDPLPGNRFGLGSEASGDWVDLTGLRFQDGSTGGSGMSIATWSRYVRFPLWPLALATAALPAVRIAAAWRKRRRSQTGLCQGCGYDLRASPLRCPECGRPG